MNKKRIRNLMILAFLIMVCVASIGCLAMMHADIHLNDSNSSKFFATVDWVYKTNHVHESIYIETKEFNADLLVSKDIYNEVGIHWIYTLQEGDRIVFRVRESDVPSLMSYDPHAFCFIVELVTEEENIFSLTDHNAITAKGIKPAMIQCSITIGVCILFIIWFVYRIRTR